MTILNRIWRELQNEPQLDYATAMNFSRIHHFFITETRNRKPNNRGIHNRNRNFKNRARILISEYYMVWYIFMFFKIFIIFANKFFAVLLLHKFLYPFKKIKNLSRFFSLFWKKNPKTAWVILKGVSSYALNHIQLYPCV